MIERLSGDYVRGYVRGYTKAIRDVMEVFGYIIPDLKYHHMNLNAKQCLRLMSVILEHREKIRDGWNGFIRYNNKLKDFEWFSKGGSYDKSRDA